MDRAVKLRRRLFNILAGLSLLLCMGTAAVWLWRSIRDEDLWANMPLPDGRWATIGLWQNSPNLWLFRQKPPLMRAAWFHVASSKESWGFAGPPPPAGPVKQGTWLRIVAREDWRNAQGLGYTSWELYTPQGNLAVQHGTSAVIPVLPNDEQKPESQPCIGWLHLVMPYWTILVLGSILPFACSAKAVRRRLILRKRRRRGLCLHCGYDLRASEERCPECGTAIPGQSVEPVP